ncbi:hypothetical protein LWC34_51595 [Kibdelosporangium philippinense]|uniref:Uncharacterized protein n=1 Tax=Kibdelosporangium philippinense TaxID=211113 RepID=A0ABS8ZUD3_9PSEU|nr:hypothetical protein [Kibdelosporangium philippinense]MCE7011199.1 hypothetical protein [Kibdelosporangium philippinense]
MIATAAALITSTEVATAAPENEDYLCVEEVEVCETAGQLAGGSAQRATEYLRDYTTQVAASGHLIHPGPGQRRFFGWRLSRSMIEGDRIKLYRCQLINGRPVNCRYIGDIGVQAEYHLRNRYVSDMETAVVNLMNEPFMIRHSATCQPVSHECIPQPGFFASLFSRAKSTHGFEDFQLRTRATFSMTFQWEIDDPVTRTRALTRPFTSHSFICTQYLPPDRPGDCWF